MKVFAAVIIEFVVTVTATWWLTAAHYEATAIRHGWAHRSGNQIIYHDHPSKGVWIE